MGARERENRARNFGPPTPQGPTLRSRNLRGPAVRGHPSAPHPSGRHPSGRHPSGRHPSGPLVHVFFCPVCHILSCPNVVFFCPVCHFLFRTECLFFVPFFVVPWRFFLSQHRLSHVLVRNTGLVQDLRRTANGLQLHLDLVSSRWSMNTVQRLPCSQVISLTHRATMFLRRGGCPKDRTLWRLYRQAASGGVLHFRFPQTPFTTLRATTIGRHPMVMDAGMEFGAARIGFPYDFGFPVCDRSAGTRKHTTLDI